MKRSRLDAPMAFDPTSSPSSSDAKGEFMSRSESRKLLLMGLGLLLLVLFLIRGSFGPSPDRAGEPAGIPVNPGRTGPAIPPSAGASEGPSQVDPDVPSVRPTMDPAKTLETLKEVEEEQEAGRGPRALPFEPSDARLNQVQDLARDLVEEPGFYELIARVHRMSDEELAEAPEAIGTFTFADLRKPPGFDAARARETGDYPHLDAVRGKFVRMRGRFATYLFQRVLADYPNEAGLAWVWQGTFVGPGGRPYFLTITDKTFEPVYGRNGEPIELVGAFLKLYSYKPVGESETTKTVPHLVVKRIHRAEPLPKWDYMVDSKLWVAAGVFLLFLLAIYLYARASRKGAAELEQWRRDRLAKRTDMSKAAAAAKPPVVAQLAAPDAAPTEDATPADEAAPTDEAAPADEAAPTDDPAPTDDAPAEDPPPA